MIRPSSWRLGLARAGWRLRGLLAVAGIVHLAQRVCHGALEPIAASLDVAWWALAALLCPVAQPWPTGRRASPGEIAGALLACGAAAAAFALAGAWRWTDPSGVPHRGGQPWALAHPAASLVAAALVSGALGAWLLSRHRMGRARALPSGPARWAPRVRTGVFRPLAAATLAGAGIVSAAKLFAASSAGDLGMGDVGVVGGRELAWWVAVGGAAALVLGTVPWKAGRALGAGTVATLALYAALATADALAAGRSGVRYAPATMLEALRAAQGMSGAITADVRGVDLLVFAGAALLPALAAWWARPPRSAGRDAASIAAVLAVAAATWITLSPPPPASPLGLGIPLAQWLPRAWGAGTDGGIVAPYVADPRRFRPPALGPLPADLPHVVLYVFESTPWAATSLADPALGTTPVLARLAAEGLEVRNVQAHVPHTTKSLVALHCGLAPGAEPGLPELWPGALEGRCLPALLAPAGVRSRMIRNAVPSFEAADMLALNLGFGSFLSFDDLTGPANPMVGYFGGVDRAMVGPALAWLQQGGPRLVTLMTVQPHHDYVLPPGSPVLPFGDTQGPKLRHLNLVHQADAALGELVAGLEASGLAERTLLIAVGDHGEAFGEHGVRNHGGVVHEEVLRVPLVLWGGALRQRGVIDGRWGQESLLPTVLALLGVDAPEGSFPPSMLGPPPRVVYGARYLGGGGGARVEGGIAFLDGFGERPDERYDLRRDPHQRTPLPLSEEEAVPLRQDLRTWRRDRDLDLRATRVLPDAPAPVGERCAWVGEPADSTHAFVRCWLRVPPGAGAASAHRWQLGDATGEVRPYVGLDRAPDAGRWVHVAFPIRLAADGGELWIDGEPTGLWCGDGRPGAVGTNVSR